MNIKDFRRHFTDKILQRGQMYLKEKRVSKPEHDGNGNYTFTVEGTDDYTVCVYISPEGELSGLSCDCPYDQGGYCKHIAAALLYLEKIYDKSISNQSSKNTSQLISIYCRNADISSDADNRFDKKIRIVPELTDGGVLFEGFHRKVSYDDPTIEFTLRETKTGRYSLKQSGVFCKCFGQGLILNTI